MTGLGVYYPDGGETQQVGIIPDIRVALHIDAFRNKQDELLQKAIAVLKEEKR
jgi:C-terminal processing protease CtpA/Prc